jgi:antirestriction protein ArdC
VSARIHEEITGRIVLELEQGVVPWTKPWQSALAEGGVSCLPRNTATGYIYRGVNVLTLWAAAAARGYPLPRWLTFCQTTELGGFVRKGERATAIVLLKRITVTGEGEEADKGEETDRRREVSFLRSFAVFNVAQTEGLPERLHVPEAPQPEGERHAAAEAFLEALRIRDPSAFGRSDCGAAGAETPEGAGSGRRHGSRAAPDQPPGGSRAHVGLVKGPL